MELDSEQEENAEYSFMMGEGEDLNNTSYDEFNSSSVSYSNTSLNQSINRSGNVRITKQLVEVGVQTDPVKVNQPKLRVKAKVCTDRIKATIISVWGIRGECSSGYQNSLQGTISTQFLFITTR